MPTIANTVDMTPFQNRWNLLKFSDLESTNQTALEWLKRNPTLDRSVILAQTQRAGRGQRGTQWQDSYGKSLLMTLILQPSSTPLCFRFSLNMLFSLSVVESLRALGVNAQIKWPNDIVLNRKKIGGILIETGIRGESISHALLGLGLNLYSQSFKGVLHAASIEEITGIRISKESFLDQLEITFEKHRPYLKDWDHLYPLYFSYLIGTEEEEFIVDGQKIVGILTEVEPSGHMQLQKKSGEKLRFNFKEIQFVY